MHRAPFREQSGGDEQRPGERMPAVVRAGSDVLESFVEFVVGHVAAQHRHGDEVLAEHGRSADLVSSAKHLAEPAFRLVDEPGVQCGTTGDALGQHRLLTAGMARRLAGDRVRPFRLARGIRSLGDVEKRADEFARPLQRGQRAVPGRLLVDPHGPIRVGERAVRRGAVGQRRMSVHPDACPRVGEGEVAGDEQQVPAQCTLDEIGHRAASGREQHVDAVVDADCGDHEGLPFPADESFAGRADGRVDRRHGRQWIGQ